MLEHPPLEPFERVPLEVKAGSQEQRYVEGLSGSSDFTAQT